MGPGTVPVVDLRALTYDLDRGVALVTLDRPERLNAWTSRMEAEFRWALGTADADPDVRVIVVTGAGRGFCAGADFQALDRIAGGAEYGSTPEPVAEADRIPEFDPGSGVRPDFEHRFSWLLGLSKPVIAAVNGGAAGVGFVLLCFSDIRFAAAGAKITTAFGRLGLPAEHGVSWMLSRLIGTGRAADLLFSSRVVLAEEAAEMGLVNRVLPPEQLLPETLDYAAAIARDCSPSALREMKRQLWNDALGDLDTAARTSMDVMVRMMKEPDFAEGNAAFQEKRPPRFRPLAGNG